MAIEFAYLADHPEAVPIVARWYHDEWGYLHPQDSIERTRERVGEFMNRDRLPFILVAMEDDEVLGIGQLKLYEMAEQFPDKEHWLGGLYVPGPHRGHGYGTLIAERIAAIAPGFGVRVLYLQTEALDGGLYARLGWTPVTRANNGGLDVLVMERTL